MQQNQTVQLGNTTCTSQSQSRQLQLGHAMKQVTHGDTVGQATDAYSRAGFIQGQASNTLNKAGYMHGEARY